MTQTQTLNRLHKQMAEVVALEAATAQALDQLIMESSNHPEVTAMLREFHAMTKGQLYALDTRLQALAANVPIPDRTAAVRPDGESGDGNTYPVSTALQTAYTLFNRALIEYAALQVLAIRFRDSWAIAADGTTAHLARQHTQNYVHAMQQIARVLHDVVVWEMDHEGLECQCVCPSTPASMSNSPERGALRPTPDCVKETSWWELMARTSNRFQTSRRRFASINRENRCS